MLDEHVYRSAAAAHKHRYTIGEISTGLRVLCRDS